ncbi:MAG TPA: CBS domain-containing protein [Candidatus Entotheonella sp.]|jgi:CBS domain-containing protein
MMKIQTILNTKGRRVFTIQPHQSVREALMRFVEHNIGSLVVVNDLNQPIGMLSERDIIRAAVTREAIFTLPVGALMNQEVITGMPDADLEAVAHMMTEKRTRHVLVLDDEGCLAGIVSIGDVVKAQRDRYQGELYTLETQLLMVDTTATSSDRAL